VPNDPEIMIETDTMTLDQSVEKILGYLKERKIL
jgi:adenylylsulfate kinase-like enzyme